MSRIKQDLATARTLLAAGWVQGNLRIMKGNRACYCITGAVVAAVAREDQADVHRNIFDLLCAALGIVPTALHSAVRCVVAWNDQPGRTQAEVLDLFDRAIEACR